MKRAVFLSLIVVFISSCINGQIGKIKGSGHVVKENRKVNNFKGVKLAGSMDVVINQGSSFNVVVEADDNLVEYVETSVKNDVLYIGTKNTKMHWISSKNLKVYVTLPELTSAGVSGSGSIRTEDAFTTSGQFNASVSGSGDCNLNVKAQNVDAHISGSGSIVIAGTANNTTVGISGSGNYKGLNLETKDADIHISGSGNAETSVSNNLAAHISGSGDVRYKGNAAIKFSKSGSGKVSKI